MVTVSVQLSHVRMVSGEVNMSQVIEQFEQRFLKQFYEVQAQAMVAAGDMNPEFANNIVSIMQDMNAGAFILNNVYRMEFTQEQYELYARRMLAIFDIQDKIAEEVGHDFMNQLNDLAMKKAQMWTNNNWDDMIDRIMDK